MGISRWRIGNNAGRAELGVEIGEQEVAIVAAQRIRELGAKKINDANILARNHNQSDGEPDFREETLEAFTLTPHNVACAVGTVDVPVRQHAIACHPGRATGLST